MLQHLVRPALSRALLVTTLCAGATLPGLAQAGELYANVGLPGLGLGYAHAINSSFTVRGDFATLGSKTKDQREDGIDYRATAKFNRIGLFADWFFWGGARVTGGVTSNNMKISLLAQGNGQQMTVGNNTFTTATDDRLNIEVKFPRTTPYLGLGYGHQLSSGVGFVFDIGASYGKAKLTETHSGTNLGDPSRVSQADIDAELAELRDGVGKVKYIPQISFGIAVRF